MKLLNISQQNRSALKNPWVLGMALLLITVLTVNGIFIYLALKHPPNLVVKDFYEKGEAYTAAHQKSIEDEKALGWTGVIMIPGESRVNQKQTYEVLIHGKDAEPVSLDSVKFYAYRPSDSRDDFSADMMQTKAGTFTTDVSFKLPGTWDLIVEAKQGDRKFMITRRISISP